MLAAACIKPESSKVQWAPFKKSMVPLMQRDQGDLVSLVLIGASKEPLNV